MLNLKKFLCSVLSVSCILSVACAPVRQETDSSAERIESSVPPLDERQHIKAEYPWNESADISNVDAAKKLVAFTFDDAPSATLKDIMRVFANYNSENPDHPASATIFVNGIRVVSSTRPLLQAAHDAGFELGNHTYSHSDLTALSTDQIRKEIDDVDMALYEIDGKQKHLVRAPYGKFDDKVKSTAGAPLIDWAVDTEDWKGIPAEQIYNSVLSDIYAGAIVLMHDGYPHTVEALEKLLPALKEEGYQIVNVSQLFKAWNCPFAEGSIYTHVKCRK
jgi:peptidoglycan/xylan/chitin deacetylase (PgdA/CDA1 family)